MKTIYILTTSFPYGVGEQFLESEIKFWAEKTGIAVVVIPNKIYGKHRVIPSNVAVDLSVAKTSKYSHIFAALFSLYFIKELFWLKKNKKLSVKNVLAAWLATMSTLRTFHALYKKIKNGSHPIVCYSYWFDTFAYGAAILKREGSVNLLVTRAHGFDVYEERRFGQYMPLKRQFSEYFDKIYAVSENGEEYLQKKYNIPPHRLQVSRLGVDVAESIVAPSPHNLINILSVSFCTQVKRIDRIIDAISLLSKKIENEVMIRWTHIGDGELKMELESAARLAFKELKNVEFQFLGHISNSDVHKYYEEHHVDVFINTSESEGVPVSIMEAMSFGVPVIATDVGGVSELVNTENGWLLSSVPTISEIVDAISLMKRNKSTRIRKKARQTILANYSANKNYQSFVDMVMGLVDSALFSKQ